jgi:hypothetical protein
MKVRIKGNAVRLRLSKTDVVKITTVGYLEERTLFGANTFIYALQRVETGDELTADFDGGKMTMFVPESLITDWGMNDVITFESFMEVSESQKLHLLLEKDFQCLDNTGEDQFDNYTNPNKTC